MNQNITKFRNGMTVIEKKNGKCVVLFSDGTYGVVGSNGILQRITDTDSPLSASKPSWFKHFISIGTSEKEFIKEWAIKQDRTISFVRNFLYDVMVGLALSENDTCYPTIEPSVDENDNLYYKEGEAVCISKRNIWWEKKALAFAPEYHSRLANKYELMIFYAYRAAMEQWSLRDICYNSSSIGNFYDSPSKSDTIEKSGAREVGGARDGIGNTNKLVKTGFDFEIYGGCYRSYGKFDTVTKNMGKSNDYGLNYHSGVVVLTKVDSLIGKSK